MAKAVEAAIPPPVGGVNLTTSVDKIQSTEAVDISGFEFDEYGVLGAPRGPKSLGTIVVGAYVLSAHKFQHTSAATQLIVHLSDGSLRYSTDFLTTSTTATWTTIASGLDTSNPFSYTTWLGKVWMGNGVDDFRSWDGSAQVTYASAPKGKYLALWRDLLWMGGDPVNPHRIYSSDPGDPTVWSAFNFVDIGKGEADGIVGIFAVETALAVFKLTKTHIIYDPIEYTNRIVDHDKGCLSHFSIVSHNGLVYFASHLGFCRFLGDGPSLIISEKLAPLFDDLTVYGTSLGIDVAYNAGESFIWGYSFENFVGWYFPNFLLNQYVKYYPDLPDKPWLFGVPASASEFKSCVVPIREPGKQQELYVISDNPAILKRQYDAPLSDAVACRWVTGWYDFGEPMVEKYLTLIEILHRGTITVRVNRDYKNQTEGGEESEVVATGKASELAKLTRSTLYLDNYGYQFQFEISASTPGEQKQLVGSGINTQAYVTRWQAGVAALRCTARLLSVMRR